MPVPTVPDSSHLRIYLDTIAVGVSESQLLIVAVC